MMPSKTELQDRLQYWRNHVKSLSVGSPERREAIQFISRLERQIDEIHAKEAVR